MGIFCKFGNFLVCFLIRDFVRGFCAKLGMSWHLPSRRLTTCPHKGKGVFGPWQVKWKSVGEKESGEI